MDDGNTMGAWTIGESTTTTIRTYLKIPRHYFIKHDTEKVDASRFSYIRYWGPEPYAKEPSQYAYGIGTYIDIAGTGVSKGGYGSTIGNAICVRPFKDEPVIPDNSRATLYDGSASAIGAGMFRSQSLGLISISSDGVNWTTITDKDLGAANAYNKTDGSVQSDATGYLYQWGNNYPFNYSDTLTTTSTAVDTTGYGPGNYYSSNIFINIPSGPSVANYIYNPVNADLWGGITGAVERGRRVI